MPIIFDHNFVFPEEESADALNSSRIANLTIASELYPEDNVIVVDFGVASTLCAMTSDGKYLGGLIMPGLKTSADALCEKDSLLPPIDVVRAESILGTQATSQMQAGLYFEKFHALKGLIADITDRHFFRSPPVILGTGDLSASI